MGRRNSEEGIRSMSTTEGTNQPLRYKGVEETKWDLDLDKGEFGYVRHAGVLTYIVFWPWDSPTPLLAAIAPHRNGQGATWTLSGSESLPTLQPSVDAKGIWHGFLTNGVAKHV